MSKETKQNNLNGMEITATKPKMLEDGVHYGTITELNVRTSEKNGETFQYVDIHIETLLQLDTGDDLITLRVGYPLVLTELSSFGQFLKTMNFSFKEGETYKLSDIAKSLIGTSVKFQTTTVETTRGTFANIIKGTVKPQE